MSSSYLCENENYLIIKYNFGLIIGINKLTSCLKVLDGNTPDATPSISTRIPFDIVLGKIQFEPSRPQYLVVVTGSSFVGNYLKQGTIHNIRNIELFEISYGNCLVQKKSLGFNTDSDFIETITQFSSSEVEKQEEKFINELLWLFNKNETFYYSKDCDITNTLQRKNLNEQKFLAIDSIWKKCDKRFFWNSFMMKDFIELAKYDKKVDKAIIPIIRGYVNVTCCSLLDIIKDENFHSGSTLDQSPVHFNLLIISRQSHLRSGTRYKCRGIDNNGNVANFVETEQILDTETSVQSYVIIRGSIPLFWQQSITWKYKPSFILYNTEEANWQAFKLHMSSLSNLYGKLIITNLINNSGREKAMRDTYLNYIFNCDYDNLSFFDFDFHFHCKNNKYENVNILVDILKNNLASTKSFWQNKNGFVYNIQEGVVRVNCIDCLDRTNVVQAAISKHILIGQLRLAALISDEFCIKSKFNLLFNKIWASNGDNISKSYAGTSALKSDFTRTGERKFAGMVLDGYKSVNRYYYNIFRDSRRQVVHDIMHGKTFSATYSLAQWKINLEDSVQSEHKAAMAVPSNFHNDNILSPEKLFQQRHDLIQEILLNYFPYSSHEFIELWLIDLQTTPKQEFVDNNSDSNSYYEKEEAEFALIFYKTSLCLVSVTGSNNVEKFIEISYECLKFLKVKTENQLSLLELSIVLENFKQVKFQFNLINCSENTNIIDTFCKKFVSHVNSYGNGKFYYQNCSGSIGGDLIDLSEDMSISQTFDLIKDYFDTLTSEYFYRFNRKLSVEHNRVADWVKIVNRLENSSFSESKVEIISSLSSQTKSQLSLGSNDLHFQSLGVIAASCGQLNSQKQLENEYRKPSFDCDDSSKNNFVFEDRNKKRDARSEDSMSSDSLFMKKSSNINKKPNFARNVNKIGNWVKGKTSKAVDTAKGLISNSSNKNKSRTIQAYYSKNGKTKIIIL